MVLHALHSQEGWIFPRDLMFKCACWIQNASTYLWNLAEQWISVKIFAAHLWNSPVGIKLPVCYLSDLRVESITLLTI